MSFLTVLVLFVVNVYLGLSANQGDGALRLFGGNTGCEGTLEVYHDGEWGTICNDDFGLVDAQVACDQLDCGVATDLVNEQANQGRGTFSRGTGKIWLDDVACVGTEEMLGDCQSNGWGSHNCGHHEDIGIRCSGDGALRLVGGNRDCEGTLEVAHNGEWGTICNDDFGLADAQVACRQLGCGVATDLVNEQANQGKGTFARGTGKIWLDNVACVGNEETLEDCQSNGWGSHNCGHHEDIGIRCASLQLIANGDCSSGSEQKIAGSYETPEDCYAACVATKGHCDVITFGVIGAGRGGECYWEESCDYISGYSSSKWRGYSSRISDMPYTFAPMLKFSSSHLGYPKSADTFGDDSGIGTKANMNYGPLSSATSPVYYSVHHCDNEWRIMYYFFYGGQEACLGEGSHLYDKEKVMASVSADGSTLISVRYSQHNGGYTKAKSSLKLSDGTHPWVYSGRIAHGSYYNDGGWGDEPLACAYFHDLRTGDQTLDTQQNLIALEDARNDLLSSDASICAIGSCANAGCLVDDCDTTLEMLTTYDCYSMDKAWEAASDLIDEYGQEGLDVLDAFNDWWDDIWAEKKIQSLHKQQKKGSVSSLSVPTWAAVAMLAVFTFAAAYYYTRHKSLHLRGEYVPI